MAYEPSYVISVVFQHFAAGGRGHMLYNDVIFGTMNYLAAGQDIYH